MKNEGKMKIHRIRSTDESGTLTYIIEDSPTKQAAIIDANLSDLERVIELVEREGLSVTAIIDTHTHADHKSAAGELRTQLNAPYLMHPRTKDKWKIVELGKAFGIEEILRANAGIEIDGYIDEGDVVKVGGLEMRALHTPGHTDNHISLYVEDALFTGDLLLIGQAGRSDLPGGDPRAQYTSLYHNIMSLPGNTKIYPGHDYENNEFALLSDEMASNPFLQCANEDDFVDFVAEYFPPIADAGEKGQVVLQCGTQRVKTASEKYTDISPEKLAELMKTNSDMLLLDVREEPELRAFGAIPGVTNISSKSLSAKLDLLPKDRDIVVICQSGGRSAEAAHLLAAKGFHDVYNLLGGTGGWIARGFPVERPGVTTSASKPHFTI